MTHGPLATTSKPDPGGVFASDAHRRVMANVPNPDEEYQTVNELLREERVANRLVLGRVAGDEFLSLDAEGLQQILLDLEADGYVKQTKAGWRNTAAGWAELTDKDR